MMNKYQQEGYENRYEYLKTIAVKYNCHIDDVLFLAESFGEEEDFDGLVISLSYDSKKEVKKNEEKF